MDRQIEKNPWVNYMISENILRKKKNQSEFYFLFKKIYNFSFVSRKLCNLSRRSIVGISLVSLILGILLGLALLLYFLLKSTTATPFVCSSTSCVKQLWSSSSNLLAKWEFDNNLLEDVTNSTSVSTKTPIYTFGYIRQAFFFSINSNQSVISPIINLTNISFTIDAWIYHAGFSNQQDYSILSLCPILSSNECLYLTIRKNGSNHTFYFGFTNDDCPGNAFISAYTWIHVAFVFDITSLTQSIYINGQLDATRIAGAPFTANPNTITIGNTPLLSPVVGSNYFHVRFYYSPPHIVIKRYFK